VGKKNQSHSSVCITNESGDAHTWFNYENGDNYITSDSSDTAGDTYFRDWDGSNYSTHMVISGDGYVTKPNHPAFASYMGSNNGSAVGILPFSNATVNVGSHFNGSSNNGYRFVAPVAGQYYFHYHNNHAVGNTSSPGAVWADFYVNGSALSKHRMYSQYDGGWEELSGSVIITLATGDYVQIYLGTAHLADSGTYSSFSGHLIG